MNFPKCDVKSNGANFPQQNRKCSRFTGTFKQMREISSQRSSTVFGVIEIEVSGESGVFQDYLNFNPQKPEKSMGFLVAHCKAAAKAAGLEISDEEEHDMEWVQKTYESLMGKSVRFEQTMNANGQTSINYLA